MTIQQRASTSGLGSFSADEEVVYVAAGRLKREYEEFCESRGISVHEVDHVRPYDTTTLFCPAGMQQFKPMFRNPDYRGTLANIQACLRINDLDEIGDGTHLLNFEMMGLFSFREMSVEESIDFWFDFLSQIGALPDRVTIHPDRMDAWRGLYDGRGVEVAADEDCVWSDGEIGGYCTEFYRGGVEIGNIVNTGGDCIDVGFGLDRLLSSLGEPPPDQVEALRDGVSKIIESGYEPGPKQQGYVLRKLLRELVRRGAPLDHPFYRAEAERQSRLKATFERLWSKHSDKPAEWWLDTHGIELADFVAS
ncbi:MAG TPA: alanine--tRNA ligase-related protein [Caulobacteraceae bacterium]|nr:alanine--tRNA ligase-related protein [Caulobacteraceae bacterium]